MKVMTDALTGDPELDVAVPHWPRVLPEITWISLSATKVLAAGSLNAALLPSKLGDTSLLSLLRRLNGKNTLGDLIGAREPEQQNIRRLLRLLYQIGLLEDGSDPNMPEGSTFYALTMDQTRLHSSRKDALASSQRPVWTFGVQPTILKTLKQIGVNCNNRISWMLPAFQLLMLDYEGKPISKEELLPDVPVLPIRLHGDSVDIGPWLPIQGGCTLSDLQDHIAQEESSCVGVRDTELLEALCAHTISLILAGATPVVMTSTLYRISLDDNGPCTESIAVSNLVNQLPDAAPALRERLLDRAKSTMPALRHVGTKSYEVHYAPRNLMAAFEIQESGFDPVTTLRGVSPEMSSRIMSLLSSVFGCIILDTGQYRRNCPTGGNLGSPEPLVWVVAMGFLRIYRYLPLSDQLECVLQTSIESTIAGEIGLLCLGNKEKMCRKYGPLGVTLVHLDGGFAKAFLQASADVEGLHLQNLNPETEIPAPLRQLVDERRYHYVTLWGGKLQLSPDWRVMTPDKIARRAQFSNIVKTRRSMRIFDQAGVTPERYAKLIHVARSEIWPDFEKVLASFITPILRVREKEDQHFYVIDDNGLLHHLCSENKIPELFLQRSLDRAPLALFLIADLLPVLKSRQERGLDMLISICGQWLGGLWLSITSNGLGGCPCGAAVEIDLQAVLPSIYQNHSIIASFVAGRPVS